MNIIKLALSAAIVAMSANALAADYTPTTTREQRMNEALRDYRDGTPKGTTSSTSSAGPMARTEESVKKGFRDTGSTVKRVANKAGHAVATGARKTGHAIHRGANKLGGTNSARPTQASERPAQ